MDILTICGLIAGMALGWALGALIWHRCERRRLSRLARAFKEGNHA